MDGRIQQLAQAPAYGAYVVIDALRDDVFALMTNALIGEDEGGAKAYSKVIDLLHDMEQQLQ